MFAILGISIFMAFWWLLTTYYIEHMAKKLLGKGKKKKVKVEKKELDIVELPKDNKPDNVIYIKDYVMKKRMGN